jgi:SAM-dependent methyltransferase
VRDLVSELAARPHRSEHLLALALEADDLREALPLLPRPERIDLLAVDTDAAVQAENVAFFQGTKRLPWRFEVANARTLELGSGELDLVYSTGLFDYLGGSTLAALWRRIYASLAPGGVALVSVKDGARFCPLFYRWAVPWSSFRIRTEHDFDAIFREAGLPRPASVRRDATGCILFYVFRKA